jgi:hypothetical protein
MHPVINQAISADRSREMREQAAAWRRARDIRRPRALTRILRFASVPAETPAPRSLPAQAQLRPTHRVARSH